MATNPKANQINYTPTGTITATNVQDAITQVSNAIPSGVTAKIVVIGDSQSSRFTSMQQAWPEQLQDKFNAMGGSVSVVPVTYPGMTFFRANTVTAFNGVTAVNKAISLQPTIIVVALGLNDTLNAAITDNRTLAQVQSDASTLFSSLATALPTAKIVFCEERPYDSQNFSGASCKNKGILPKYFQLKTSGIFTGCYVSNMLDDPINATTLGHLADWISLSSYIQGLGTVTNKITLDLWRIARMGGCGPDGLHFLWAGTNLMCGYVFQALLTLYGATLITGVSSTQYAPWDNPTTLWSNVMTSVGDGWTFAPNDDFNTISNTFGRQTLKPNEWYLPHKAVIRTTRSYEPNNKFAIFWKIEGAAPNTVVEVSIDSGGFSNTSQTTNDMGNAQEIAMGSAMPALSVGNHTFYYRIGNIIIYDSAISTVADSQGTRSFSATKNSNVSISASTFTQITGFTAEFNVGGDFSGSAFNPKIAGKYQVNLVASFTGVTGGGTFCILYKNGSRYRDGSLGYITSGTSQTGSVCSAVVAMNGFTDTLTMYVWTDSSGGCTLVGNGTATHFSAIKVA